MIKLMRNGIFVIAVLFFGLSAISSCSHEEENDVFNHVSSQLEDRIGSDTDEEDEKKQKPN